MLIRHLIINYAGYFVGDVYVNGNATTTGKLVIGSDFGNPKVNNYGISSYGFSYGVIGYEGDLNGAYGILGYAAPENNKPAGSSHQDHEG